MKKTQKKSYEAPCILSVTTIELEQGIAASSSTLTVGGNGGTTPQVTDWNEQPEQTTTLDL